MKFDFIRRKLKFKYLCLRKYLIRREYNVFFKNGGVFLSFRCLIRNEFLRMKNLSDLTEVLFLYLEGFEVKRRLIY